MADDWKMKRYRQGVELLARASPVSIAARSAAVGKKLPRTDDAAKIHAIEQDDIGVFVNGASQFYSLEICPASWAHFLGRPGSLLVTPSTPAPDRPRQQRSLAHQTSPGAARQAFHMRLLQLLFVGYSKKFALTKNWLTKVCWNQPRKGAGN